MKFVPLLASVILSSAIAVAATNYVHTPNNIAAEHKETAYERVLRTGEIRCGYTSWNPLFYIDPKTNEKKGIFHDMMEEIGKRMGVKIVWQEELGWGTVTESVRNGRVDMACSGYWLNPARIKNILSSIPQIYAPLYIWARQDDNRPIKDPEDLNSFRFTVANADGSAENEIIALRFPQSKVLSLPELATNSDIIESLTSGKADFIIIDAGSMAAYETNNPNKVKNAFLNKPMSVFPNVMLLPPDDWRFKDVIDNMLRNIEYDGTLDIILKKYKMDQSFLRNPMPVKSAP